MIEKDLLERNCEERIQDMEKKKFGHGKIYDEAVITLVEN